MRVRVRRLGAVYLRDRLTTLGLIAGAVASWVAMGILFTTRSPRDDPQAQLIGAALLGLACGLTVAPLAWLVVFARNRRIAYRGDWVRAGRRGLWVALVVGLLVVLRAQAALSAPIAAFVVVLVAFVELTLSVDR